MVERDINELLKTGNVLRELQKKYLATLLKSLKMVTQKTLRKIENFRCEFAEHFPGPFIVNSFVKIFW